VFGPPCNEAHRVRRQDLSAIGDGADAGGFDKDISVVVTGLAERLAGRQPDANPERLTTSPVVAVDCLLDGYRAAARAMVVCVDPRSDQGRQHPRVGFIGVGDIGGAMASRLTDWPGGLTIFDLNAEAMSPLITAGAVAATSIGDVGGQCDIVSVAVVTDNQVRQVVGELFTTMSAGSVIAIHSTTLIETPQELADQGLEHGIHVADAAVSGGPQGARDGRLALMVGGSDEAFARLQPLLERLGELIFHAGPVGSGTKAKIARNVLTYANFAVAGEVLRLADASGVDLLQLAAVVRHTDSLFGGVSSFMVRETAAPLAEDDGLRAYFKHAVEIGFKDLGLGLRLGADLDVDLPLTTLAVDHLPAAFGLSSDDFAQ
jgi:3-hydroxyisobutyrate dehydrogenase-like beta-hydroxyacid dehydrogenase